MRAALNVLLFILPFILYLAWLHVKEGNAFLKKHWERGPVIWLGLFGIVLGVGGLMGSFYSQRLNPNDAYVPARVENGRFIPGHMEARPEPGAAPAQGQRR